LLGEFHGFVDGGVWGDAIEPENLVEPETQQVDERGPGLAGGVGLARDEAVQGGLPADHAADQLMAEPPVGGGKTGGGQGGFEQIFREFTAGLALR